MFKKENLRKNFLRVKQNIDQNLGRAEKSEVLSEDQQENEKRVELVKHAFQNITKKASATLQSTVGDFDKRLKKLPESGLSAALLESSQTLGMESLLSLVCKLCGECLSNQATEQVHYEMKVENEFINPLQTICEVDIPSIIKLRKALNKSTLDMDSAKSRFNQAVRQSQVPGANMSTAVAKADSIREEYEEAVVKVETIKDNLSIELCNFAAKESEQSQKLLLLLEAQAEYHKKALQAIEQFIPLVKDRIDNSPCKPVYGMPLEEHLRLMKRDISIVIEACVSLLLDYGLEEEGLFRIAGAAMKLKKLKACFDAKTIDMEEFSNDPHTVAGALKQYLRELPEPLMTYALHDEFLKAASLPQDQRLQTLWTLIQKLPIANFNNFRYLIKFLAKLAEKSEINKMKPSNIAIVIGPNLLWSEANNAPNMLTTGTVSAIIEAIVTHADWFFPGAFDFHLTAHGSSPKPSREPGLSNTIPLQSLSNKTAEKKDDIHKESPSKTESEKTDDQFKGMNTKLLPLEQGFVMNPSETFMQRMAEKCIKDENISDESNIFTDKCMPRLTVGSEKANEKLTKEENISIDASARYEALTSKTATGDYDNILYTINPLNPSTRCSSMSSGDERRGSADNLLTYGRYVPVPPSRPSRPSKKHMFPEMSCSVSSSSEKSSLPDMTHSNSRYIIGSTPNITSLPYHKMEDENFPGVQGQLWNRPSPENFPGVQGQLWNRPSPKSNFHSLKRGSDPCITPPPPQLTNYSTQRPFKLSRAHLGTPPKPGEMSRSQSSHIENSGSLFSSNSDMSRSHVTAASSGQHNPVDKSFHQEAYSTAFALASLGAGTKSADYLTQVRAMWDDRRQQAIIPQGKKEDATEFSQHPTPSYDSSSLSNCNQDNSRTSPMSTRPLVSSYPSQSPEFDFTNVGYREDQDNGTQPSIQQGSGESLQIQVTPAQPVYQQQSPVMSSMNSSSNTAVSSTVHENLEPPSPVHRRPTRKPAPPPPPERPFTVMVTATTALRPEPGSAEVEGGGNNLQFQTWPRSAPLASPESPSEQHKSPGSQEKKPVSAIERPTVPPPDRPERPRFPQTLNPSAGRGHQRSASTGAVMNQVINFEPHEGVPNAELDLDSLQATEL